MVTEQIEMARQCGCVEQYRQPHQERRDQRHIPDSSETARQTFVSHSEAITDEVSDGPVNLAGNEVVNTQIGMAQVARLVSGAPNPFQTESRRWHSKAGVDSETEMA